MELNNVFKSKRSATIIFTLTIFVYLLAGIIQSDFLKRDFYSDEAHFIPTIRLFIEEPTIETLRTYSELTTPLVYIVYALWGKIVGSEIWQLRFFSLFTSILTFLLLVRILSFYISDKKKVYFIFLLFLANPYVFGLSIYVYTDMCTLFFLLLSYYMLLHKNCTIYTISAACVLLCRQFGIFFVGGVFIYGFFGILIKKENYYGKLCISTLLSLIPFIGLIVLWKGLAPNSGMKLYAYAWEFLYHNYFTVYVSSFWPYVLPLVLLNYKRLFFAKWQIAVFLITLIIYPFMPIKVSLMTANDVHLETNGLLNKIIFLVVHNHIVRNAIYAFMFSIGSVILSAITKNFIVNIKRKSLTLDLFLEIIILLFFVMMPAQYQVWEKYLLLIIPFVIIYFSKQIFIESAVPSKGRLTK